LLQKDYFNEYMREIY